MTTREMIRRAVEASGLNARQLSDATDGAIGLHQIRRYLIGESDITTAKLDELMKALRLKWPKK